MFKIYHTDPTAHMNKSNRELFIHSKIHQLLQDYSIHNSDHSIHKQPRNKRPQYSSQTLD
ncbi:hypothetical protein E2C01_052531 [Portunus trituberculatus]|uniref:Uncharacterized protein n=1 Tax=Portunus trituberculatus TaxID=210409 RepID=A0A5B7GM41_PORTR|nr:hypothetical protein [Portunus trituberculatus]